MSADRVTAWRECYSAIIRSIATMALEPAIDNPEQAETVKRDPIMREVVKIREALDRMNGKERAAISAADAVRDGSVSGTVDALEAAELWIANHCHEPAIEKTLFAAIAALRQPVTAQHPAAADGVAAFDAFIAADREFDETQSRQSGFGYTRAAPHNEQAEAMRKREAAKEAVYAAIRQKGERHE